MADISMDVAALISNSRVFGSSDNIRHGRYSLEVRRIFADLIENANGKSKMAFVEMLVRSSQPNPQVEGDKGPDGKLIDDGMHPNAVGSQCALKINFDGPSARSAGSNLKAFILGLFGKREGEISDADVNQTWLDLARQKDEWMVKGYVLNGQVVPAGTPGAIEAWVSLVAAGGGFMPVTAQTPGAVYKQANPACGMLIKCYTRAHKKKVPNEKGAYITKPMWECVSPPGTGENAMELVLKRRQEIEKTLLTEADDEDAIVAPAPASAPAPAMSLIPTPSPVPAHTNGSANGHAAVPASAPASAPALAPAAAPASAMAIAPSPPAPPAAPPAPPAPPAAFVPSPPWKLHPTAMQGKTPETIWYWSDPSQGGTNEVKNEIQLRR